MTDSEKYTTLLLAIAVCNTHVAGMQAENQIRIARGEAVAYKEDDFLEEADTLIAVAEHLKGQ